MLFSDLALSRRLERAEGHACAQFAEARRRLFPASGSEWMECAGTYAVFDGVDSPVTQTFGLGIFEELSAATLDRLERFFLDRGAPVRHEVSPLVGVAAIQLLCNRNYRPIEISNVLYRPVEKPAGEGRSNIRVRVTGPAEAQLWTNTNARGWTHEHPELLDFLLQTGAISSASESLCFLAELDGEPGAAGVLCIHDGVALFSGSATVPELRRRGLQAALLQERMRYAFHHDCDLAMMVAEAGSDSQRNAERIRIPDRVHSHQMAARRNRFLPMTAADFRRIALSMEGAEESSHMGAPDFRVGGRIFATLASQKQGYGNLMLTREQQADFVREQPDVFVPIAGGWGRMGMTHIRLANANEDLLAGALRAAWKLRVEKNAAKTAPRKPKKPLR